MDEARKEFFAGAAFALQQNPGIAALGTLDGKHLGLQEFWIQTHKAVDLLQPLDLVAEAIHFIPQTGMFESGLDGELKFVEIHRLDQIVERPPLDGSDDVLDLFIGGDHNDGGRGTMFLELRQDFEATGVGQRHIEEHQVRFLAIAQLQPFGRRIGLDNKVFLLQQAPQSTTKRSFIVDNEDLLSVAHGQSPGYEEFTCCQPALPRQPRTAHSTSQPAANSRPTTRRKAVFAAGSSRVWRSGQR